MSVDSNTPAGSRKAVGYIRVSQVGGREGDSFLSPELQREKIEAWAAYRGAEIVGWYIDLDRPAKEGDDRPEFDRLMTDAAAKTFDTVCVYRLTRFARSVSQAAKSFAELRKHGVELVSVTEDIDTSTASGQLMQNILFSLSEFESQRIGEEWRNVHANRRRRGLAHVTAPILGYTAGTGAQLGEVIPEEAAAVQACFQLALEGCGFAAISQRLRADGYRPKHGGQKFTRSTISGMLRNELYAGLVRVPGTDELIPARHEAIVTPATFEAVQAVLPQNAALATFGGGLLSGIAVCVGCGYRMSYSSANRDKQVYRCAARLRSNDCPAPATIAAWAAEEHVEEQLLAALDRERMPRKGRLRRDDRQRVWTREITRRRVRIEELNRALDTLSDRRFLKGVIGDDEYRRQFDRYSTERGEHEDRVRELERAAATVRPLDVDLLATWPQQPKDVQRRVARLAIERVLVSKAPRRGKLPVDRDERRQVVGGRVTIEWSGLETA